MTILEIAKRYAELCSTGNYEGALDELYHADATSTEPKGSPVGVTVGRNSIKAKTKQWKGFVREVHSYELTDPIIADNFFCFALRNDLTFKNGERKLIEEIGVFEVADGKIVAEQFFYAPKGRG